VKNLDLLLPAGSTDNGDSWYWATVTQVSPLRVRLDGDDAALPITPESLTYGLTVGKRVWVQMAGHRVIVHGVTGGYAAAPAVHTHDYAASNHTHSANRLNATRSLLTQRQLASLCRHDPCDVATGPAR